MKTFACSFFMLLLILFPVSAQQISNGSYALPSDLPPLPKGDLMSFPKSVTSDELRREFKSPPRGYGNVPFYWWNGDRLTKEKLRYELDILKESPLDGFAVSYVHTHPKADRKENAKGFGEFGRTEGGMPRVLSPEWMDIWKWFSGECAKEGLGVGLDDYTIAWTGNGFYPDQVRDLPQMQGYQGELSIRKDTLYHGEYYVYIEDSNRVSCIVWPLDGCAVAGQEITSSWEAPRGSWVVYDITTKPNYMLQPTHGKELVKHYFQAIEDQLTPEERKGANYYFQDELSIPLTMKSWSEDFPEIFKRTKGYDIVPYLAALAGPIGNMTEKVRLDYADVIMTLAEERYFKPVFDWHWERGLMYGCDNFGRGMNPIQYVDCFRAIRWFTAPGNDAPARGSSLMSTKVSSSIAHLYERPRTWLEAFHSMGWSSSGEWLTSQLDHHMIGGGNLLCLHGLYYSTRGGWWEWAPPDFHYRMPYWPHTKRWLTYAQRMSYLLSQGVHVCDVAVIYPTESIQANPEKTPKQAFDAGHNLIYGGVDFDFIDYQSLARAEVKEGMLNVSKEQYKVLVLADLTAVHHSTLEKAVALYRNGGVVIATGDLPKATTLKGRSPEVNAMVSELFGVSAEEMMTGKQPVSQRNNKGGRSFYTTPDQVASVVKSAILPDFIGGGEAKVLHRRIDRSDLYMVMNAQPGAELFFRAKGKVELWDAASGEIRSIPVIRQDENGTTLRIDNRFERSYLFVFSEGDPEIQATPQNVQRTETTVIPIQGEWEVEQVHTMDNSFGDFRLPIREKMIGAEARSFRYAPSGKTLPRKWETKEYDDHRWPETLYGYGTQFLKTQSGGESFESFAQQVKEEKTIWTPYSFSWQFGVWEHPGNQGFHGLKGRVSDQFLIMSDSAHYAFKTAFYVPKEGAYIRVIEGTTPESVWVDGKQSNEKMTLEKGWHDLLILYRDIQKGEWAATMEMFDERARGAVLFIPVNTTLPEPYTQYSERLAMRWQEVTTRCLFDPDKGKSRVHAFRFISAPGLQSMELTAFADELEVWVDGKSIPSGMITQKEDVEPGAIQFHIALPEAKERASQIAMRMKAKEGYRDGAITPYPIRMTCGKGVMEAGNWGEKGQLLHYSGGMWYRKTLSLTKEELKGKVSIDLGEVVATCEVHVNGENCGVLLNSPFQLDITKQLKEGENRIEILVYSTLSNHYVTIPTPRHYRGDARAGLIGPVNLRIDNE